MKRRFLPFSYFLSLIVLLVVISAFSLYNGTKEGEVIHHKKTLHNAVEASNYLRSIRNNQVTGMIDPHLVNMASEETNSLSSSRNSSEIDWDIFGPDNYGGRTRAVLYDGKDASGKTVFAGAVTGGIWKSTDNGIVWHKINTGNQNLFVSCMTQADDGTIYVGTGESFSAQNFSQLGQLGYSSGFMGSGVYKSTDGESFQLIQSTKPQSNTPSVDWAFVNGIQIGGDGTIYAATNTGLKYSTDNGGSWKTAKDIDGNELVENVCDVKASGNLVVASVDNECFVTSGDADKFVNHSTGDFNQLPINDPVNDKLIRIEFAIAPSDNSIVYASIINSSGNLKGVYRSENSGDTWEVILPETNSLRIFFGRGEYINTLVVFPDNPDKVLLGGLDLWLGYKTDDKGLFFWEQKSSFFAFPFSSTYVASGHQSYDFRPGHSNQIMIGTNSGVFKGEMNGSDYSFEPANRKYYTTQFYRVANSGIENYVIGGAQENGILLMTSETNSHGFASQIFGEGSFGGDVAISLINPDVIVYGSTGGFVFRSEDRGTTVSNQFLSGNITNPNAVLTPVSLWESFDNENSRDSVWYHATDNIEAGATITVRSYNSGYPFKYKLPSDTELQKGDSILVVDPISSRFFIATKDGVFMTKELHYFAKTPEWFQVSGSIVGYSGIPNVLAYSSDGNHLWVGTIDGKVYRISNLALAYNKELADVNEPTSIIANSMFEIKNPETGDTITQAVTSISVDPEDPSKVLVTFGNYGNSAYVFYTENGLDESPDFGSKQGNLPEMPVYSSIIEMSDSKRAIIGTENGIFETDDISSSSPTWTASNAEMGKLPVFDLKQQTVAQKSVTLTVINGIDTSDFVYPGATNYGIIYAGTYGRGIYKSSTFRRPVGIGEIFTENGTSNKGSLKVYPNPASQVTFFEIEVNKSLRGDVMIYNLSGQMVKAMKVNLRKGNNRVSVDISTLTTGTYIIKVISGIDTKTQKFIKF